MSKKNKKKSEYSNVELSRDAYLGNLKRYHFFLVKSGLDLYPFALQLNKQLSCDLSYCGDFSPNQENEEDFNPVFCFLSSSIHGINNGKIFVIENKTTNYNQEVFDRFKQENNLGFQTLNLFKEYYYLFGSKPPLFLKFSTKMNTLVKGFYDYIIMISHDKENYEIDHLLELIKNNKLYSVTDIYEYIDPHINSKRTEDQTTEKKKKKKGDKTKKKDAAIDYLLGLSQMVEIEKNNFEKECMGKLLGNTKTIPTKNRTFVLPAPIFPDLPMEAPVQLEEEHIILLSKDTTFE